MGPLRSDEEVYNAVKHRPDAPKVLARLNYFTESIQSKGREVDRLRKQLGTQDAKVLVVEASRLSDDISRLEYERETFIDSVLSS